MAPPARSRTARRPAGAAVAVVLAVLASLVASTPARAATTFVALQMNLCNSGLAVTTCYSFGRAVDEAATEIRRYPPDLVTLNEVCYDDLYAVHGWGRLAGAVADRFGAGRVSVSFVPAWDPFTRSPYRCVNGEQYGIAMITHGTGHDRHYGWYRSQDSSDEWRAWTCATVLTGRLTGCTTHLSTAPGVAQRQCRELMATLRSASWVQPEVIVAGDFNLVGRAGTHDVRGCTPDGYGRTSDGTLQQVFFSNSVDWLQGRAETMRWTDHPLLYERFRV